MLTNIENDEHYLEDQLIFQDGTLIHDLFVNIWIKLFHVIGLEVGALLNGLLGPQICRHWISFCEIT